MKLIINGDDFGFSRGVNLAQIDCYKKGSMKSCSLMVNMPGAKNAAELMKENPGLSVGLHLNLTVGKPLTHCPSLMKEDGTFNKGMLYESSHVIYEEMLQEAIAQYEYFVKLTGKEPDHINSHHGVEEIQGGERLMIELSKRYDKPIRRWFTKWDDRTYEGCDYVIPWLPTPEKSINTPEEVLALITDEMLQSDDVVEIAAHPGYVDTTVLEISSLTNGRAYDARNFMSQQFKDFISQHPEVENVDYRAIPKIK